VASAVVVDTMIASAWLGLRDSPRKARWQPLLEQSAWVLPFTVVAEMRFGAEVANWGTRRHGVLERLIARTGVVPPFDEVTDAYVQLRTWAVGSGHGLDSHRRWCNWPDDGERRHHDRQDPCHCRRDCREVQP